MVSSVSIHSKINDCMKHNLSFKESKIELHTCSNYFLNVALTFFRENNRFNLAVEFEENELAHWILPREGVVSSFVVENGSGEITDVGSYYHLPSSIMRNPLHNKLNAAYSFYNVATSVEFKDLMNDMLIIANKVSSEHEFVLSSFTNCFNFAYRRDKMCSIC